MALNPPQMPDGEPSRVAGEYFMLKRKSIEFHWKIKGEKTYKGEGYVRLKILIILACIDNLQTCFNKY